MRARLSLRCAGTCFQCPKVLFQDVFLSLLNMFLPTMKCSPQGLRLMDLDCEWSQKSVLIIQIDYGLFLLENFPVARRAPGCVKGVLSLCGDAHPCSPMSSGFGRDLLHCSLQGRRFIVSSQEGGAWYTLISIIHRARICPVNGQNLSRFWFRVGNSWAE